jgi:hypothetical protein
MKSSPSVKLIARALFLLLAASSTTAILAVEMQRAEVYKSPTCGCCTLWVEHMKQSGFSVVVHEVRYVAPVRQRLGVPDALESCHTAAIGGYAVEGHVPAADVKRLSREKPKAVGIAVPGMVQGSPGMEQGRGSDPYSVLLFQANGKSTVFARH